MQTAFAWAPLEFDIESKFKMPSYHCCVKTTGRSTGGSAIAHAAYRSGDKLVDNETGEIHDYSRKRGIISSEIFLPFGAPEEMQKRGVLWNSATAAETRKNSTLVREMEIALPRELKVEERAELLRTICCELVEMHGFAVDAAEHLPHRYTKRKGTVTDDSDNADSLNFHAHISMTTRRLSASGFGEKTREWDDKKMTKWRGIEYGCSAVEYWRKRVATLTNEALERAGHIQRVDERTLEAQGVDRVALPRIPREAWQIVKAGGKSEVYDAIMAKYKAQCEARATVKVLNADIAQWSNQLDDLVQRAAMEAKTASKQAEAEAKVQAQAPRLTQQEAQQELLNAEAELQHADWAVKELSASLLPIRAIKEKIEAAQRRAPDLASLVAAAKTQADKATQALKATPRWKFSLRRELAQELEKIKDITAAHIKARQANSRVAAQPFDQGQLDRLQTAYAEAFGRWQDALDLVAKASAAVSQSEQMDRAPETRGNELRRTREDAHEHHNDPADPS